MPIKAPLNVNTSPPATSTLLSITPCGGTKKLTVNSAIPKITKTEAVMSCRFFMDVLKIIAS